MGADGALQLDETSFTVRVIYSALIPKTAGRFIDIAIAGVTPATDSCVCIPIVPYSTNGQSIDAIAFIPYVYEGYVRSLKSGGHYWADRVNHSKTDSNEE